MIAALIDKQDNFEVVRDQIAAILALETKSQQALARAAGRDPNLWKLRVYSERSNPLEVFLNDPNDRSPVVNVWYSGQNFDKRLGNVVERQSASAVFNIDCLGYAVAADNPTGGHKPGDREAAFEAQRAVRLVRNILMAGEYTYLGLRGTVWRRWVDTITAFQPPEDGRAVQQVLGNRLAFGVDFNELSPQVPAETLELLTVDVKRAEDGEIVVEADYEYPIV